MAVIEIIQAIHSNTGGCSREMSRLYRPFIRLILVVVIGRWPDYLFKSILMNNERPLVPCPHPIPGPAVADEGTLRVYARG